VSTTAEVARYIAGALADPLPPEVETRARLHIIDSLAAIAVGTTLEPVVLAREYATTQHGPGPCTLIGSPTRVQPAAAAFAHGMAGHADESDDSHEASMSHPGCSIVPAVVAMAQRCDSSFAELTRAVALGYDIGTRINLTIGIENLRPWDGIENSHALAGVFGSAAGCAAILRLDEPQARTTLSYAAQQAAGIGTAFRDTRHVEKAFVFGGMPARNGVVAAELVAAGFTGVEDVFEGQRNFFHRFRGESDHAQLTAGLGSRFEIAATNIKKYSVGSPNQTVLQSVEQLLAEGLTAAQATEVIVEVPAYVADIVDSSMPDISARYLTAVTLLDGGYSFQAAHDFDRMRNDDVLAMMKRITIVGREDMGRSRAARVVVRRADGAELSAEATAARGSVHDPMTAAEVLDKAMRLLSLAVPEARARAFTRSIMDADGTEPVRAVMALVEDGAT
jgi:2-methylcitrate dehydratase PrpD